MGLRHIGVSRFLVCFILFYLFICFTSNLYTLYTIRLPLMSFICSNREQTNNTKCSTATKRLYFWQRQRSRREPALVLKLDYARKWTYAEELSPRSCVRSTCGGFLANAKAKRDESRTTSETQAKEYFVTYHKPTKYRNEMKQSEDESSRVPKSEP